MTILDPPQLVYDSRVDALYFTLNDDAWHHSVEFCTGQVVDYNEQGDPIGIELYPVHAKPSAGRVSMWLKGIP